MTDNPFFCLYRDVHGVTRYGEIEYMDTTRRLFSVWIGNEGTIVDDNDIIRIMSEAEYVDWLFPPREKDQHHG